MSEKIELIGAKDLPMTEEEDVTVLCVGADGEMKRRDAGSFGGGKYDATIRMIFQETDGQIMHEFELVDGGYDAAKAKIDNDEPAIVRLIELHNDGTKVVETVNAIYSPTVNAGLEAFEIYAPFSEWGLLLLPDNTITDDY